MPEQRSEIVLAARRRLEAEIRAKFPPGRYWDSRALAKTVAAIERCSTNPMPEFEPTNSPTTAPTTASVTETLSPANIDGSA